MERRHVAKGKRDGSNLPEKVKKGRRGRTKLMKGKEERTDIIQEKRKALKGQQKGNVLEAKGRKSFK